MGPLTQHTRYYWRVDAVDSYWTVKGLLWQFDYGTVPVLFTRFDARQSGDDVEVRWELVSDEAMTEYTLYRRDDGAATALAIASAPVRARGLVRGHVRRSREDVPLRASHPYDVWR